VSLSADGKLLASASADKTARIIDVATGRTLCTIQHDDKVFTVSLSADGKLLASGSADKTARITDVSTGQPLLKNMNKLYNGLGQTLLIINHNDRVSSVSLSADGKLLASHSNDGTTRITDIINGKSLQTIKSNDGFMSMSLSADGKLLANGSMD
jgi:WD40 repeat protein